MRGGAIPQQVAEHLIQNLLFTQARTCQTCQDQSWDL